MARIDTDEEHENRMGRIGGGQQQISDENEAYLEDQEAERDEVRRQADIDYGQAQRSNAAQPRGRWDAGTQTFVPDDPTHGKASRKWNPGGVSQWDQALRRQRDDNFAQMLSKEQTAQGRMWGEFSSVMNAVKQKRAQESLAKQNASASLMRVAMENGGAIPDEAVALYNRMFGYDGRTSGLVSGSGFMKDGSFNMRMIGGADANGRPVVQDVKADLPTQFVMMNRNRQVFDQNAVYALADKLKEVGYSPREIENMAYMGGGGQTVDSYRAKGGFGDGSAGGRNIGGTTDGKAASRLFGRGGDNRSRISVFGTGGAGTGYTMRNYNGHTGEDTGFVDDPIRQARTAELANGSWSVAMSGNRRVSDATTDNDGKRVEAQYEDGKLYRNSKTGEEVWVPEGSSLRQVMANAAGTEKGRRGSSLSFDERKQLQDERIKAQQEQHKADQDALTGRSEQSRKERERREKRKSLYGELKSLTNGGRIKDKDRYGKVLEEIRRLDEEDGEGSQATPGKEHNNGGEALSEFDPKRSYKVGDKFTRKGKTYEVGRDGQPHPVG